KCRLCRRHLANEALFQRASSLFYGGFDLLVARLITLVLSGPILARPRVHKGNDLSCRGFGSDKAKPTELSENSRMHGGRASWDHLSSPPGPPIAAHNRVARRSRQLDWPLVGID